MQEFLKITFWKNTIQDYLFFLGSLIVSLLVLLIIERILLKRLEKWADKTPTTLDDMLIKSYNKYLMPLSFIAALYFNTRWLTITDGVQNILNIIMLAFVIIYGAMIISALAIFLFNKYLEKRNKPTNKMAIKWFGATIRILIWIAGLLLFLDILEVPITTLVAGLGIGGIAIAFAAQAILEDIFSFVTIFFDRPFELDDFIIVDDLAGTVEHIGVKTTRLRSLSGEQLVFSNKDLTNSRIHNYKRMESRRIVSTLGVTYDTPTTLLKEIPSIIKAAIISVDSVAFERAHFSAFGDFSLNFEVAYLVHSQDYAVYMEKQQDINFLIKEAFDEKGIEFAFPTQTLFLEK